MRFAPRFLLFLATLCAFECATGEKLDDAPSSPDASVGATDGASGSSAAAGVAATGGTGVSGSGGATASGGVSSGGASDASSAADTSAGGMTSPDAGSGGGTVDGSAGIDGAAGSSGTGGGGTGGAGTGGAGTGGAAAGGSGGGGCVDSEVCNGADDDGDGLVDEPSSQNTAACNGCTPIQRNGFAYWFCTGSNRDWQPSETNCTAKGAHLASIHDQAENDFVSSTMIGMGGTGRFWIGLIDRDSEGNYVWLDGTPVDYTYFNCSTTATLSTGSEDCANINGSGGCWDDDDCSGHSFRSVCRAPHQPACQ